MCLPFQHGCGCGCGCPLLCVMMMIRKRSHINHTPCCAHLCANGAPVQLLGQCRAFKCSFELLVNCHLFTYSKIGLSWIQSESVKARTAIRTWSAIAIPDFQFGSACSYHSTFMRTFVLPILFFQRFFLIFHFPFPFGLDCGWKKG